MKSINLQAQNTLETEAIGYRIGKCLEAGSIIGLVGNLGAGKTFLSRAIALGLDIPDVRVVNSPTFVLIQEYAARLPIYHFDTYRLANPEAYMDLGVEEYWSGEGVCLIEWSDRIAAYLPADYLRIEIQILEAESRQLILTANGPKSERLLAQAFPE